MGHSLDRLTIKGFKSIRLLENFELTNLNIFIGANGSGKSNLVGFFRLIRCLVNNDLSAYVRNSGGFSSLLFNGRKITSEMEFEISFKPRAYHFRLLPTLEDTCVFAGEKRFFPGKVGWWDLGDSHDDKALLVKDSNQTTWDSSNSKVVYDIISSWQIYHFHDTSKESGMRNYEIIEDGKRLRMDAANIAPFLLLLKEQYPREYQEILDAIVLVLPFFDDFILDVKDFGEAQKVRLSWKQKDTDYPFQPYHFSDGSIRFICLVVALLQPNPPATIIIDEPELGLHPVAISILAELIQATSKKTQVIIATQSSELINHFVVDDIVVVNREHGQSTFKRLKENEFSVWLDDYSLGELWTKNIIQAEPQNE